MEGLRITHPCVITARMQAAERPAPAVLTWTGAGPVAKALAGAGDRGADLPVRAGASGLRVVPGYGINPPRGVSRDRLLPPTEAGSAELLARAKEGGRGWTATG